MPESLIPEQPTAAGRLARRPKALQALKALRPVRFGTLVGLLFRAAPRHASMLLVLECATALARAGQVYGVKLVIDALTGAGGGGGRGSRWGAMRSGCWRGW